MRISTMACHALHLLLCLADHDDTIPASASELATYTGISEKFVQKIMRLLQGGGMVRSVRGIAGGHVLARSLGEVTLADIIAAVEGGISLPGVSQDSPGGRTALTAWAHAADNLQNALRMVTLDSVRKTLGTSSHMAFRELTEPAARHVPEIQAGGPHAKAHSLGRQRCRKPRQAVPDASSA